MQAVVKTPRIDVRITGEISKKLLKALGNILGGLPKQHISNMENNRRAISLEMAKKLASAFNTSPARFLLL